MAKSKGMTGIIQLDLKRETDKQNQLNVMAEYLHECPAMGRM
jgi:hypothetical protein